MSFNDNSSRLATLYLYVFTLLTLLLYCYPALAFDPADGLLIYWDFERDAVNKGFLESSGNGAMNNFSEPDCWIEGRFGSGLSFNGLGWIDIDDNALADFQDRTISIWIKRESVPLENEYIFGTGSPSYIPYRVYLCMNTSGEVYARVDGGTSFGFTAISDGQWYHIVLVLESDDLSCMAKLYVNGELKGSQSLLELHTGDSLVGANLGSYSDGSASFLDASVDDFRIYNYSLSDSDVNELYIYDPDNPYIVPEFTSDLMLWYKFDETSGYIANDSVSDNFTFLFNFNTSSCWVEGKYGNGLSFDGINDWVDISDSSLGNFHDKTIAVWAKVDNIPSKVEYIFGSSPTYRLYLWLGTDGNIYTRIGDGNPESFPKSPACAMPIGQWTHLAIVLRDTVVGGNDKCTAEFYMNGELVASRYNLNRHTNASLSGANIGSYNDGSGSFFKGIMDDFRIYNRPLSVAEIKRLYVGDHDIAWKPYPKDGQTGIGINTELQWMPGDNAVLHRVYLSENYSDVYEAQPNICDLNFDGSVDNDDLMLLAQEWLENSGSLDADITGDGKVDINDFVVMAKSWKDISAFKGEYDINAFTPDKLDMGQTYFWRVDEVYSTNDLSPRKGRVNSFRVNDYLLEDTHAVLHNPDMGWVIYDSYPRGADLDSATLNSHPYFDWSMIDAVQLAVTWADIEASEDVYDFSDLDYAYDWWATKGKEVTLRLCSEPAASSASSIAGGIPQYVLDAIDENYKYYSDAFGYDWWFVDQSLTYYQDRLIAWIDAVQTHYPYDGSRPYSLIDLRGYGKWGEWHGGYPYGSDELRVSVLKEVINIWVDSLSNQQLAISTSFDPAMPKIYHPEPSDRQDQYYPEYTTNYNGFLWYNALDYAVFDKDIGVRRDGCGGSVHSNCRKAMYSAFADLTRPAIMTEGFPSDPDFYMNDCLDLHSNYINCAFSGSGAVNWIQDNPGILKYGLRNMGYRFVVTGANWPSEVELSIPFRLTTEWINRGVGRAIHDYKLKVILKDNSGSTVFEQDTGYTGCDKWIKGLRDTTQVGAPYISQDVYRVDKDVVVNGVNVGIYYLHIMMIDSRDNNPIGLAVECEDSDGSYRIGYIRITE